MKISLKEIGKGKKEIERGDKSRYWKVINTCGYDDDI